MCGNWRWEEWKGGSEELSEDFPHQLLQLGIPSLLPIYTEPLVFSSLCSQAVSAHEICLLRKSPFLS